MVRSKDNGWICGNGVFDKEDSRARKEVIESRCGPIAACSFAGTTMETCSGRITGVLVVGLGLPGLFGLGFSCRGYLRGRPGLCRGEKNQ